MPAPDMSTTWRNRRLARPLAMSATVKGSSLIPGRRWLLKVLLSCWAELSKARRTAGLMWWGVEDLSKRMLIAELSCNGGTELFREIVEMDDTVLLDLEWGIGVSMSLEECEPVGLESDSAPPFHIPFTLSLLTPAPAAVVSLFRSTFGESAASTFGRSSGGESNLETVVPVEDGTLVACSVDV